MTHRIMIAALMSCVFSVTLALLFACVTFIRETGGLSVRPLFLPGVLPLALVFAAGATAAMTPLAMWAVRTGEKNMWRYGPVFWLLLAAYILFVIPRTGPQGPYGLIALAVVGTIAIGFIPAAQ